MEYKIVDIPIGNQIGCVTSPIVTAMVENPGKAISIPLGGKDANNLRKTLRAAVSRKPLVLTNFYFRTRVVEETLVVWLENKVKE